MSQSDQLPHRLLRAWQLALLRFAVTRDESDGTNVAALATELDRNGGHSLHFFRRTSTQICSAISGQNQNAGTILEAYCQQIDEPRLRLAFAAATGLAHSVTAAPQARPKRNPDLFKGLPARRAASL